MMCGYGKIFGEKRLLGGNIFHLSKNGTTPSFVKTFGLTSGISVRGTVGLTLVRKGFKCFNFYRIEISYFTCCISSDYYCIREYILTER